MTVLRGNLEKPSSEVCNESLYRTEALAPTSVTVTAIPYFAWDNREPGEMLVWVREG